MNSPPWPSRAPPRSPGSASGQADRCAILAEIHYRWFVAYLGTLRLGAVAVPLDTAYTVPQVLTGLRDSDAKVLVASPRYLETAREAAEALAPAPAVLLLSGSAPGVRELAPASPPGLAPPALPVCPATEADPAVMLFTSATTRDPKGVVLSHGNLRAPEDANRCAWPQYQPPMGV